MSARTLTQVLEASSDLTRIAIEDISAVLHHPAVNPADRLDVMLALTRRKPASVFWPVFHEAWRGCDDTYHSRNRLLKVLANRDAESRATNYLTHNAQAFLESLPNPFIAFRGCCRREVMGLSWTTNECAAVESAQEHRGSGALGACLATASVPKSAVYGVYLDGDEAELVMNPRRTRLTTRHLGLLSESTTPSTRATQPERRWERNIRLVLSSTSEPPSEDILTLTDLAP